MGKLLYSKYNVGGIQDQQWLSTKRHGSSTWRNVVLGLKEVVSRGRNWVIRNGRDIRFWYDKWLSNKPLIESAIKDLPNGYTELRVKEFWRNGSG